MLLLDRYNIKMKKSHNFSVDYFISLLYLLLAIWGGIHKLRFQTFDDTLCDGSMHEFERRRTAVFAG